MRISGKREVQNRREAGGGSVLSTFHLKPSTKRSAFTLIEMIGVMALMAILAAVVVPPLIRTLEDAQQVNEDANLEVIADALVRGIKAYRIFPNPNSLPDNSTNGWVTLAKNFYPKGTNELRYVFPKIKNFSETERRVYLDPILVQYLSTVTYTMPSTGFSSTLDLNTNGVVDFEETIRMYLVSSSKQDLVLYCGKNQSGQLMMPAPQDAPTYGASMISDLQNWIKAFQTAGTDNFGSLLVPSSIARWGTASGGNYKRGEYLHVKIVPLDKIFCRVTLTDCASPASIASIINVAGKSPYERNLWYRVYDGYGTVCEIQSNSGKQVNSSCLSRFVTDQDLYNDRTSYPSPYNPPASIFSSSTTPPTPNPDDSTATFNLPGRPYYQLNSGLLNQFSTTPQVVEFYVLSGTRLRLYGPTQNLIRDELVSQDLNLKYWNSLWAVDEK